MCTCSWSSQLDSISRCLFGRVATFLVTLIWISSFFSKNTLCQNQIEYSNYELISVEYREGVEKGCTF